MNDNKTEFQRGVRSSIHGNFELVVLAICSVVVIYSDLKQVSILWLMFAVICSVTAAFLLLAIVILGPSLRSIMIGFVFASVILSVWVSNWPIHAAFRYSQSSLDNLVEKVIAGQNVDLPQYAGIYRILAIDKKNDGTICLWTDIHSSGNAGFVKTRDATPSLNLGMHRKLTGDWHVVAED